MDAAGLLDGHDVGRRRRAGAWARAVVFIAAVLALGGCGGEQSGDPRVLRVPDGYATIQRAVDEARPGDLVLISPGVYREQVTVPEDRPRIVIRGADRNRVVLDGQDRRSDGIAVRADGVAVENLTVRRFRVNGVVWSPAAGYGDDTDRYVQGWRGSYLTAYDNGLYGVYAFGAQHGRFDHVYASGHPDSGVYVGRCKPCHALVRDSVAELNHVGYEATNASGDVVVEGNTWRRNRVGVQINSLSKERGAPQSGSVLTGNRIAGNQAAEAPRGSEGFGAGVVINGGSGNLVARNRVSGHAGVGIIVLDSPDYPAADNEVRDNRLARNRVDLALRVAGGRSRGTCFAGNRPRRSAPPRLEQHTPCGRSTAVGTARLPLPASPPQVDYRRVPAPPPQPSMPAARTAPPRPASGPA